MNCKQCLEVIIKELQGELEQPLSEALHEHINECQACRKEYEEIKWLQNGMRQIGKEVESAHMSSRLLYDFVVSHENLNDDTIRFIRHHLEQCADCKKDLKIIKDLNLINLSSGDQDLARKEPGRSFWARFSYRKSLLAYSWGAISIIIIAALVIYFQILPSTSKSIYFVKNDSIRSSDYIVKELVPIQITRSSSEKAFIPPLISIDNRSKLVLKINLDLVEENMTYRVKIFTEKGETLWEANIEKELLSSGSLLLFLEKKRFDPGLYYVEIIEHPPEGRESLLLKTAFRFIP